MFEKWWKTILQTNQMLKSVETTILTHTDKVSFWNTIWKFSLAFATLKVYICTNETLYTFLHERTILNRLDSIIEALTQEISIK